MNVAFYGRYSSDNQRDTSIADQQRVVERWAERHGHGVVARFADSAVSGANIRLLTGLQNALDTACRVPPPFDAIVVDQLSRLSRDIGDTDALVKRLRFFGVRIVAVSDGLDTQDETTKISVTVKSLVNELYLDDLRKTTKRGLDGQFLKGYSTGGRTYGYRSEPVRDASGHTDPRGDSVALGYRLFIVPEEAEIVRQIFRLFADGHGEKTIAKRLNSLAIGKIWRPNTIFLMLQNSKYVGRLHFNRREWRKNPATGRKVYRWRPSEEWEVITSEGLRIVDDVTWHAVERRLHSRQHRFSHGRTATRHLLSGLLLCDRCGGRFSIVAKDYYGCRNYVESGSCSNGVRFRLEAIEELVISQLARNLLGWIEALSTAATHIETTTDQASETAVDDRLAELRNQASAVMDAIQTGLRGKAREMALSRYQNLADEIEQLGRERSTSRTRGPGRTEIRYDRSVVEDFLQHLPSALRADPQQGREFLQETLKSIRIAEEGDRPRVCPLCREVLGKLTPQHLAQHGLTLQEGYRRFPELGFNKRARLVIQPSPDGLLKTGEVFGLMVAGAGFEPATFGL